MERGFPYPVKSQEELAPQEKQRAECQAAKLRELNIDPDVL
ncbi:hypothetical protein Nos7524_4843 [Nostoc sp. PCC 7524]|nr:hypothetical protein [Nostoc sp. PCC 7524]AFY50571.1 hypothetical protein Nos7524_4843 [Nostoc sp. PCC 7524]